MVEYTLGKKERLNSKTLIERLFSGGSKSFPAFPLRVVYMSGRACGGRYGGSFHSDQRAQEAVQTCGKA